MTDSIVSLTSSRDSAEAGAFLGKEILTAFAGASPDAVILFASAQYHYSQLLKAFDTACRPGVLVGCSSAGEFINKQYGEHSACAVGLRSTELQFSAGIGRKLSNGAGPAAKEIASSFKGVGTQPTLFHNALVLSDPLSGHADELIEQLTFQTDGTYRFFGGGAGDDARFLKTHVFYGTEAATDAAVALEILSRSPIGVGVQHGWQPSSRPLRVTEADGMKLTSLDGSPAAEVIHEHAEDTNQPFDPRSPLPFFLHNVLGIDTGGGFKLRVPLAVNDDGSLTCAAEVPEGSTVYIMRATTASAAEAAAQATRSALEQLQGGKPGIALFFDCVATRLRTGNEFGLELQALEQTLGPAKYAGCNTYGQIARAPGQFDGFHNCTAVVCVIPA